jgi:hypothetical protein
MYRTNRLDPAGPRVARILWGLAAILLPLLAASGAQAAGDVVYRGSFAVADVAWSTQPGGNVQPRLAGTHPLLETGRPDLIGRTLTLLVPAASSYGAVEIVPLSTRKLPVPGNLALAAAPLSSEGVPGRQQIVPASKTAFPADWGRFGGNHVMNGFRLVTVTVHPLRALQAADGSWREVELLESYEVRLLPVPGVADRADAVVRQRRVAGERSLIERRLAAVLDNPEALAGYLREDGADVASAAGGFAPDKTPSLSGSAVSYLIITNEALAAAFQPLADYRTSQGLPAVVKSLEWIEANYRHGVDIQETVRLFIRDAYERWGVEYVLLGGDTDVVPARYALSNFYPPGGTTDIPADLYFACLDGNWNLDGDADFGEPTVNESNPGDDCDIASDVSFGRAPVSTVADVNAFVSKVLNYENAAAGDGFANRFLTAAEVLFTNTEGEITLDGATYAQTLVDEVVAPCTDMTAVRMFEAWDRLDGLGQPMYPGAVPETRLAALDSLNTGHFSIFNQIGHGFFFNMDMGDANITITDAGNLHNGIDRTFLMYALNCASAAFDYGCLMERFVQNPNGGSFASIGASRAAFPATANDFQKAFFDAMMCDAQPRLGDLMAASRLPWLAYAPANSFTRWTFMNYTLLGDPAQSMWTASPAALTVGVAASVPLGAQYVPVTITAGGQPVVGARVVLSRSGDVYAWGDTDVNGQVLLYIVPVDTGTLTLTVTARNAARKVQSLPVAGSGAYIALQSMTVTDNGTGGTIGNGNGVAEAGETVAFLARFQDTGSGGAAGVTAVLGTAAAGVTVLDGNAAVATIPSGGSANALDTFLVRFDAAMADGNHASFLVVADNVPAGPWSTGWELVVAAPEVEPIGMDWFDAPYGDNDGVLENNERVTVMMTLENFGAGRADGLTAVLRTSSPNVVLYDSLLTYPNLDLLQTSSGTALVSLKVLNVALPYDARIVVTDARGRRFVHAVGMTVPAVPTDLESVAAPGPDVIELTWTPVNLAGVRGYHVYRSQNEAGPFTRANFDLLGRISYFRDTGLDLLTRYYYRVTCVDSFLVEGVASAVFAKSTSPSELSPFPLPFDVETSSHCAVGDVTGDHRLEIVMASDEVYVWTEDGQELFDGDDDSQTLGPITSLNGRMSPMGVTLANLDADPALEILCADRDLKLLYAFNADGTQVPGWPQSTGTIWVWTPPAVGDIDGDGGLEVVVNNLAGRTLAWHADGTEVRDGDNNPATLGVLIDRSAVLTYDEWCRSAPSLEDLDGDGAKDIIFGTRYRTVATNQLLAYRHDGTQVPGFPIPAGVGGNIMCSPTIADLDNDGLKEIVYVSEEDSLRVVRQNGTRYPGFPRYFRSQSANGDVTCPSPAVGDFDNDGRLEIVAVEVLGATSSNVHVVDTDVAGGTSGQTMSGWPRSVPGNSESSPVVGDLDGDHFPDVVFGIGGGDTESPNNLYAFSHDGLDLDGFPLTLGGPVRPAPVICDLDQDGHVNLVYGGWDLLIHVWDLPATHYPNEMTWPTFRGHYLRDGVFRYVATTPVEEVPAPAAKLTLTRNVPNPFNPSTTARLYVPEGGEGPLAVEIFDAQGRLVRSLHRGPVAPGWLTVTWHGQDDAGRPQASGVYFLRAQRGGEDSTLKMLLVK